MTSEKSRKNDVLSAPCLLFFTEKNLPKLHLWTIACQTFCVTILTPRAPLHAFSTVTPKTKGVVLPHARLTYVCACLTEIWYWRGVQKKIYKKTTRPKNLKLAHNMPKTLGYVMDKFHWVTLVHKRVILWKVQNFKRGRFLVRDSVYSDDGPPDLFARSNNDSEKVRARPWNGYASEGI